MVQEWFIAINETDRSLAERQFLGLSTLWWIEDDPKRLDTGMTGVLLSRRGKLIVHLFAALAEFESDIGPCLVGSPAGDPTNPQNIGVMVQRSKPAINWGSARQLQQLVREDSARYVSYKIHLSTFIPLVVDETPEG